MRWISNSLHYVEFLYPVVRSLVHHKEIPQSDVKNVQLSSSLPYSSPFSIPWIMESISAKRGRIWLFSKLSSTFTPVVWYSRIFKSLHIKEHLAHLSLAVSISPKPFSEEAMSQELFGQFLKVVRLTCNRTLTFSYSNENNQHKRSNAIKIGNDCDEHLSSKERERYSWMLSV